LKRNHHSEKVPLKNGPLMFKPNQVKVIEAIVEIRDEPVNKYAEDIIIKMVEYELKDGILIAENFIEKWKKYGIVIAKKTSRIIEEPTVFPRLRPIDWS
jgi:hypothetical protein